MRRKKKKNEEDGGNNFSHFSFSNPPIENQQDAPKPDETVEN